MINKDKKDRVVRQFVTYCRMALRYEKINYYNERKRMAERESHMEMFSEKQLETVDKIFDTYHADYFYVMGYEIGIVDGDLQNTGRRNSFCRIPERNKNLLRMRLQSCMRWRIS